MTNPDNNNPVYILGAGAIGCLWACYLQSRNIPCVLVERSCVSDKIWLRYQPTFSGVGAGVRNVQFEIPSIGLDSLLRRQTCVASLIVTTKSQHAVAAVKSIKSLLADHSDIITLCNGFGLQDELLHTINRNRSDLLVGVTSDGVLIERCEASAEGQKIDVFHTGKGRTFLGYWNSGKTSAKSQWLDRLASGASRSILEVFLTDNIPRKAIEKFFINCAINSLTALHQCQNGQLLKNADFYRDLQAMCDELQWVYNAMKQRCDYDLADFDVLASAAHVAELTAANTSSMLRDRQRKKPLELAYLNNHLKELAGRLNISTPFADNALVQLKML